MKTIKTLANSPMNEVFGTPFFIGSAPTGSMSVTYFSSTNTCPNGGVRISLSGARSSAGGYFSGAFVVPVFPQISLPRRWEMSLELTPNHYQLGDGSGGQTAWIVGNVISGNLYGYGSNLHFGGYLFAAHGNIIKIVNPLDGDAGLGNFITLKFEQKTLKPQSIDDIVHRYELSRHRVTNIGGVGFSSQIVTQQFPSGTFLGNQWVNMEYNKLFFLFFVNTLAPGSFSWDISMLNLYRFSTDIGA